MNTSSRRRTEDDDSDVDVFLARLVLGGDGVAPGVAPQTDGHGHNRRGVCGLHLDTDSRSDSDLKAAAVRLQTPRGRSHLRVHGQRVQLVLLVRLGFAVKVPGHLGSGPALDGGRDPDGISGTDAHQVLHRHVKADGRRHCPERDIGGNISKGQRHETHFEDCLSC